MVSTVAALGSMRGTPARQALRMLRWLLMRLGLVVAIAMIVAIGSLLISGRTTFGASPQGERLSRFERSPEWRDGRFNNPQGMWGDTQGAILRSLESHPNTVPGSPVPVVRSRGEALAAPPRSGLRVTWFGHSSSLIEIDGVKVLTDPIWSERPSPVAWVGPKRWYEPPIALRDLPRIDAVVISHDHYDHLDQPTVAAIAAMPWNTRFIVPLGVGAHLAHWGVPEARIVELDWWQSTRVGAVDVIATPARHASGRVTPRSDRTLWAGYALAGPTHRAYYSGDTGFFPALRDIGSKLGPFDVTLIESGQYDGHWPDWHLGPEQAVEANRWVRGRTMIPVHWALFKLAQHGWTEPVERVEAAARCRGDVQVLVPRPGESVEPTLDPAPPRWWPSIPWETAQQRPVVATVDGVASHRFRWPACGTATRGSMRDTVETN